MRRAEVVKNHFVPYTEMRSIIQGLGDPRGIVGHGRVGEGWETRQTQAVKPSHGQGRAGEGFGGSSPRLERAGCSSGIRDPTRKPLVQRTENVAVSFEENVTDVTVSNCIDEEMRCHLRKVERNS